ncbi:MAG: phosphatase PAP2 family protein [Candidatus Eremiobacteraeota bacterium]|nr:phosphatase PAP2 family protein [Candidatus Eremiobacteraeota bacterium]MCW5872555.1 phosphatase PAP2 family protein [Candidatus Eremiobacteraeota bacterium]
MRWFAGITSLLALAAFADIGEDMHDPGWPGLEKRLASPLAALRSTWMTWTMLHLTWLGNRFTLSAIVVLACLSSKTTPAHKDKAALVLTAVSTSLLNLVLKEWFARARPGTEFLPLVEEPYYSFPSGHAMISLAVYGFLAYLGWLRSKSYAPVLALVLLILMIAASRVYLAVHYPGDVLAGLVAGWPCLCLAIALHANLRADAFFARNRVRRP